MAEVNIWYLIKTLRNHDFMVLVVIKPLMFVVNKWTDVQTNINTARNNNYTKSAFIKRTNKAVKNKHENKLLIA